MNIEPLLRLLFPVRARCMACGSQTGCERDWICESCAALLEEMRLSSTRPPKGCGLNGAAYVYLYKGPAGGIIRSFKYGGARKLGEPMAQEMLRVWQELADYPVDVVACVPMHPRRVRQRGYNQAEVLAKLIAEGLGLPYEPLLYRTRYVRSQASMSDEERRKSLVDAFGATDAADGRRVLLVDDVCTTGTTAHACAENLRAHGAKRVYLLCFAAAYEFK